MKRAAVLALAMMLPVAAWAQPVPTQPGGPQTPIVGVGVGFDPSNPAYNENALIAVINQAFAGIATPVQGGVNYIQLSPAATGSAPSLVATGSDTNIGVTVTPKGNGVINLTGSVVISGWSPVTLGLTPASQGAPGAPGTGYVPGDVSVIAGGTFTQAATVNIFQTQAVSGTVAAGGTGGTPGACTVTGTTGTGTKAQYSGTVSGGALQGPLSVAVTGLYTANPTVLTAEPVTGCGLTGAQVSMVMGVGQFWMQQTGIYSIAPLSPASQASNVIGSGTGATFPVSFGPLVAGVSGSVLNTGVGTANGGGNFRLGGGYGSQGVEMAGASLTTGIESTFVGDKAGLCVSTGSSNTAFGHNALGNGVAGSGGGVNGGCANGFITSGSNTAIGQDAMRNAAFGNTASGGNTAVGAGAMHGSGSGSPVAISGSNNTALGSSAGLNLTTGSSNTFLGQGAAAVATTASNNTIIGQQVGFTNFNSAGGSIFENILVGMDSSLDTATSSTIEAIGIGEGPHPGTQDVIIGYGAGQSTNADGNQNVIIGENAGHAITSGPRNVAIGRDALASDLTGNDNVAVGRGAGQNATGGSGTYVGSQAGLNQTSGAGVFVGQGAGGGSSALTGNFNTAVGISAGNKLTSTANSNSLYGVNAGQNVTTGNNNTIVGNSVGSTTLTTGHDNLLLGTTSAIDVASNSTSNTIQLGAGSTCVFCATGGGTPSTAASTITGTLNISGGYAGSGGTAIPSCTTGLKGARAYVTDAATSPAFMGTYTAGAGAVTAPVVCNGSNWLYGALPPANDNHLAKAA